MKNNIKGFSHVLIILVVLVVGVTGYFLTDKINIRKLQVRESDKNHELKDINISNVEIDNSKTVYYDQVDDRYKFIENHSKFLVGKSDTNSTTKEVGFYYPNINKYKPVYKTEYEELRHTLSPQKDYILISDVIQNPTSEINYKLVEKMKIIDLNSFEEIEIPFPKNHMFEGVLWKLNEDKVYITARKPEGLDYSFKWYYEFNLKSKNFRLVATSDDFVLKYGNSDKNFGHFVLGFSGFDSSGSNIIGIGQTPEDPHLLTVWRINPEARRLVKLYDYNVDTKHGWLIADWNGNSSTFENNQLNLHSHTQLYSMNLLNGEITDLKKAYKDDYNPDIESDLYEYVSSNGQENYVTLRNKSSMQEVNYAFLKDTKLSEYSVITTLD